MIIDKMDGLTLKWKFYHETSKGELDKTSFWWLTVTVVHQ